MSNCQHQPGWEAMHRKQDGRVKWTGIEACGAGWTSWCPNHIPTVDRAPSYGPGRQGEPGTGSASPSPSVGNGCNTQISCLCENTIRYCALRHSTVPDDPSLLRTIRPCNGQQTWTNACRPLTQPDSLRLTGIHGSDTACSKTLCLTKHRDLH
jgi:hypothetical protein